MRKQKQTKTPTMVNTTGAIIVLPMYCMLHSGRSAGGTAEQKWPSIPQLLPAATCSTLRVLLVPSVPSRCPALLAWLKAAKERPAWLLRNSRLACLQTCREYAA
jgi:hypothetical protein